MTWDLSSDTLRFLEQNGMLGKLSNKPISYGGSMEFIKAFDGSNYTNGTGTSGDVTPEDAARLRDAGYGLGMIQALIAPPTFPHAGDADFPRRLAQTFIDGGIRIDGYLYWILGGLSFPEKIRTLSDVTVRQWWVDFEERPANLSGTALTEEIRSRLAEADAAPSELGEPAGVYTAWWWIRWYLSLGGDITVFDGRKLWWVGWDGAATPEIPDEYHPEDIPANMTLAIKQFAGTSSVAGVGGIDLNVLTTEEGNSLDMQVPEVPQDYRDKFALSGPYDWPGVAANLEGIIKQLQGEVAKAPQPDTGAEQSTDRQTLNLIAEILKQNGYDPVPDAALTEQAPTA